MSVQIRNGNIQCVIDPSMQIRLVEQNKINSNMSKYLYKNTCNDINNKIN